MRTRDFFILGTMLFALWMPQPGMSWGNDGHAIIGNNALPLLTAEAREKLEKILHAGPVNTRGDAMRLACNWPDDVRKTDEWEWSAPLHFVNIPRTSRHYDRQRDCGDGGCVTAAVVKYAQELGRDTLDIEQRWQAFAFLCHFVGDLHQPLHAAYKDDRGANRVNVSFRGELLNLHEFWDSSLSNAFLDPGNQWTYPMHSERWTQPGSVWDPATAMAWTDESHATAALYAYPPTEVIDETFARRSWLITREQWQKAAFRLATILNAVLGGGDVVVSE